MLGNYFYNEILRKTIISFGTLFNDIEIVHKDKSGDNFSRITVPIAYGPVQKFLARIEQSPNVRKEVAITLPRMSFEMTGISYDPARKSSTMQTFRSVDKESGQAAKAYLPVPYNIKFRLSIMSKLNEDALQIVEQVLPYFQPHLNLTIDLVSSIGEKRDVPMILESIGMDDQYEGDFTTRRILIYTLDFTAKTYLFGPVTTGDKSLIKKVQVDYHTNTNKVNSSRQLRYVVEPRAIKDYDGDATTTISSAITREVTKISVSDATPLIPESYIQIGSESMYITKITGNNLNVNRGQDGTTITTHESGSVVNVINAADDQLIDLDDDFGFSETRYDFTDGKIYSTTKGTDV